MELSVAKYRILEIQPNTDAEMFYLRPNIAARSIAIMPKQGGFTLIELMIVVGVLGILVSISGPAFSRYQAKARQAEAKFALGAIFTLEKAFYAEYGSYLPGMSGIGYTPEGSRQFYMVGWGIVFSGSIAGVNLSSSWTTPRAYFAVGNPLTNPGGVSCANSSLSVDPVSTTDDPQTFTVTAIGVIRNGATVCDNWTINELKILKNTVSGL